MWLEEHKNELGNLALVLSILQMMTPIPTCYRFYRKKSVGDMIVAPYTTAFLSCSLWLYYGVAVKDTILINVNLICGILQFCYVVCYYAYCTNKSAVQLQFSYVCLFLIFTMGYCVFQTDAEMLVNSLGMLTCFVTVIFFVSPLGNLRHVLRVWNSESLPSLLIFATFVVSILWTLYGWMAQDSFITVPNLLGTILSGLQLCLILILPRESKSTLLPS